MTSGEERWTQATLALACFALDPAASGGIWLRARSGPVRDRFTDGLTQALSGQKIRRLHPAIGDDALFGGVDLSATLAQSRVVKTAGLLGEPAVLILPMAERAKPGLAARLAAALDGPVPLSLVALDEGAEPGEALPGALADRLALHLDLDDLPLGEAPEISLSPDDLAEARQLLPQVTLPDSAIEEMAEVAHKLGVRSLRAPLQALAVARASAALYGENEVDQPDLITAVELVLAPRATQIPAAPEEEPEAPPDPDPPENGDSEPDDTDTETPPIPAEILLEAARAMLPPDLLERLAASRATRMAHTSAGSGARRKGNRRGRPMPSRPGHPGGEARVDLVASLRAAAPWQPIRREATGQPDRLHIRTSDLRLRQFEERSDRAIIFLVDASGSAALSRLAEAKGAVELLLAEAYARRDHVALIAFRGAEAEILLPPTRSLVQTKRRLGGLPGGGGTPLASGLKAALDLAELARGKGMTPSIALLTDGRANIALDGSADRVRAAEDATQIARAIRGRGISGLVIDMGNRATPNLADLAREMAVSYLALPRADAHMLSRAVDDALEPVS